MLWFSLFCHFYSNSWRNTNFYFIPTSEFNAYLKQIKVILSTVKKITYFFFTSDLYDLYFSLYQTETVSIIYSLTASRKDLECTVLV